MANPPGSDCEIVVGMPIGQAWSEWLDDFEVTPDGANSRLTGKIVDQAALHGILGRLRDLGVPILDVHVAPDRLSDGE